MIKHFYVLLLPIFLYATTVNCTHPDDLGKIIFVNILYRHGNRTPVEPYPTDPYKNISYWPTGWGQLTKDGMMGHYMLGKWFRQRYSSFLPNEYDRNDIFVQSTDVDRTLMSAYSNLAGLYEPSPSKNWDPDIKWRPIPVHTIPEASDMVLAMKKKCPKYDNELKILLNSEKFINISKENKVLFETVSSATGTKIDSLDSLEYIYNTLFIENLFNFELPEWTKNVFPEPMKSLADFSFSVPCYTPLLARLKVGPLLKQLINNMKEKADGKLVPNRKMWMYSAHDTTVGNLLQALGCYNNLSPPYFSTILMELREKDGSNYVTVYYRNSSLEEPHLMTIPGCSAICPLSQFIELLQPILPTDWERECHLSLLEEVYNYTSVGIMAYASVCALSLLLLAISVQMCRKRSLDSQDFVYHSLSAEAT